MHPLRSVLAIGVAGFLSACFMSETPFIPESEAVRLNDESPILVCSNEDECSTTVPNRGKNTYLMMPPPDEEDAPMPLKFAPLMETAIGPVWLAEIDMSEDDQAAFVVGVARRAPEYDARGMLAYDIELPWCDDVSEEEAAAYGIEKMDSYTCSLPSKATISDYLRETHLGAFEDPEWWEDD